MVGWVVGGEPARMPSCAAARGRWLGAHARVNTNPSRTRPERSLTPFPTPRAPLARPSPTLRACGGNDGKDHSRLGRQLRDCPSAHDCCCTQHLCARVIVASAGVSSRRPLPPGLAPFPVVFVRVALKATRVPSHRCQQLAGCTKGAPTASGSHKGGRVRCGPWPCRRWTRRRHTSSSRRSSRRGNRDQGHCRRARPPWPRGR